MAFDFRSLLSFFTSPSEPEAKPQRRSAFSTDLDRRRFLPEKLPPVSLVSPASFQQFKGNIRVSDENFSFDEALQAYGFDAVDLKSAFTMNQGAIPDELFGWFSQQGFIGYQACAIISQQWLVNKALRIPARDAVRNGYEITGNDGKEIEPETLAKIARLDKEKFKIPRQLVEYETNKRRFGFRIGIFMVESEDPEYYRKPFNIDGVKPGSYKGITQVDPSWIAPILDDQAAANPASMGFYEPTWWFIGDQLYHKSHIEIVRYVDPPDILKPSYQYGGISLTQLILERVYAAERTANEAPMLAETKRLNVIYTDISAVTANPAGFEARLQQLIGYRNNYGAYVADQEDRLEQMETSLADLDDVIMSQYQLVAAVSEVPSTKLLGTSPKGFNATGEFEEKSYHEVLENIQLDLSQLLDHHHRLLIRSELGEKELKVLAVWNPVSAPTSLELAEINHKKAEADQILMMTGAIDGNDVRNRLITDEKSGYSGLEAFEVVDEDDGEDPFGAPGAPPQAGPPAPDAEGGGEEPSQGEAFSDAQLSTLAELVKQAVSSEAPSTDALEKIEAARVRATKPLSHGSTDARFRGNQLGYVSLVVDLAQALTLATWVTRAGVTGGERPTDMHVSLADDATGIPNYVPDTSAYELEILGVGELGENPRGLVLFVDSPALRARAAALEAMGAKSDFDEYVPHLSVKYDPEPGDLEKLRQMFASAPFVGPIRAGSELRRPA